MRLRLPLVILLLALAGPACGEEPDEEPTEEEGPPEEGDNCLLDGEPCKGALFCQADGCFEDASGTCINLPQSCDDVATGPVCGCDGETYANRCEAHQSRRNVRHSGACPD